MKRKNVFIILPADIPTGPVKGALALANQLVKFVPVSIVFLRKSSGIYDYLDNEVKIIYLSSKKGIIKKMLSYRNILINTSNDNVSISFCFSADLVNMFCFDIAKTISSVRGNLFKNYYFDYGIPGIIFASIHLLSLNFINQVIAMSPGMKRQLEFFIFKKITIIPNFIDESQAFKFKKNFIKKEGEFRFVFVGSLIKRKQTLSIIKAILKLKPNYEIRLDIIGNGIEKKYLKEFVSVNNLNKEVIFHGHVKKPFNIISQADLLLLPSASEGFARASLEALCLGIPIILRDVDSNYELLEMPYSGALFKNDSELPDIIISTANLSRSRSNRSSLLPERFKESSVINLYSKIIF